MPPEYACSPPASATSSDECRSKHGKRKNNKTLSSEVLKEARFEKEQDVSFTRVKNSASNKCRNGLSKAARDPRDDPQVEKSAQQNKTKGDHVADDAAAESKLPTLVFDFDGLSRPSMLISQFAWRSWKEEARMPVTSRQGLVCF